MTERTYSFCKLNDKVHFYLMSTENDDLVSWFSKLKGVKVSNAWHGRNGMENSISVPLEDCKKVKNILESRGYVSLQRATKLFIKNWNV